MRYVDPSRLLRAALAVDGATSGTLAMIQILAPYAAARVLGVPVELLVASGVFLAAYAALLVWLASSAAASRALVGLIVIGNIAWAIACLAVSLSMAAELTMLGIGYLLFQALGVLVFAGAQAAGLRQSRAHSPMSIDLILKEPF